MSPTSLVPQQVNPKLHALKSAKRGFSLAEVVIAIGIIAFALISIIGVMGLSLKAHEASSVDSVFAIMTEAALQEVRNDNTSTVPLSGAAYNFNTKFKNYHGYVYFDIDGQITKDAARSSATATSSTIQSAELGINVSPPTLNANNTGKPGVPLYSVGTSLPATTYYICSITTNPATNSTGTTTASMYIVKLTFTWPGNSTGRVILSSISNNTN